MVMAKLKLIAYVRCLSLSVAYMKAKPEASSVVFISGLMLLNFKSFWSVVGIDEVCFTVS